MIFVFTCQVISDIIQSIFPLQKIVDCLQIYLKDEHIAVMFCIKINQSFTSVFTIL